MMEILLVAIVLIVTFSSHRGLLARVRKLEEEIDALRETVQAMPATAPATVQAPFGATALEAVPAETAPPETAAAMTEAMASAPPDGPAADAPVLAQAEPASQPEAPAAVTAMPAPARAPVSQIENNLGSRWAVWVGGVALALGGVLMVRYSIENGLISPAVRLLLAALFGAAMIVAGEYIRRRGMPAGLPALSDRLGPNAMIPGILTAAGGVSLFATLFAAHQLYGFIGAGTAFVLMALVAFLILGLSLFHGQALAGLGMLGGLLAPALVEPQAHPNIPLLMAYVVLVWLGSMAASRLRGWNLVPVLATFGAGCWVAFAATDTGAISPLFAFLVLFAGTVLLSPDVPLFGPPAGSPEAREAVSARVGNWGIWLSLAITAIGAVLALGNDTVLIGGHRLPAEAILLGFGLGLAIALRRDALPAVPVFAVGMLTLAGVTLENYRYLEPDTFAGSTLYRTLLAVAVGMVLLIATTLALRFGRHRGRVPEALWAAFGAAGPLLLLGMSYGDHGNWISDPVHALLGGLLGLVLLVLADRLKAGGAIGLSLLVEGMFVLSAFLALAFGLFAVLDGVALVLGFSLLGFGFFLAHRVRPWPALPFMMVAGAVLVAARIGWDPTIVGAPHLGTTPVFNALLPAYGGPALLLAVSAWLSRRMESPLLTRLLDAAAVLMSFLAIAILVRHGMNGGVLDDAEPNLGETSIYTLLLIGFSGALLQIDRRDSSPVFVWGSMIAGGLSIVSVLLMHLVVRNPYLIGELVGNWPLLNLLLPGYLLPGLAYGGLALMARPRRPYPYVLALAIAGAVLGFAWVTLSVRQLWQGTSLADWQGFFEGETYSYSVVWLLTGVLLLVLGTHFRAVSLRYASAAVVILTVLKVFLIDLSNLEGLLRALSFIGLGLALIGIGLFYQRLLLKSARMEREETEEPSPS